MIMIIASASQFHVYFQPGEVIGALSMIVKTNCETGGSSAPLIKIIGCTAIIIWRLPSFHSIPLIADFLHYYNE